MKPRAPDIGSSFRWHSGSRCDVDAYALAPQASAGESRAWFLFMAIKSERFAEDAGFALERAGRFEEFLRENAVVGKVLAIGRALKTERESRPLPTVWVARGSSGETPAELWCLEDGLDYRLETERVLNPGLFLDQGLNRRHLRERVAKAVASGAGDLSLLNLFSYTGAFSVAAAASGVRTCVNVDLSARYLGWSRENFERNLGSDRELRLICEDARDYLRRALARAARFDLIVLDPPTFSRGKKIFRVQTELPALVEAAAGCLKPGGAMLVSSNDAGWRPADFHLALERFARPRGLAVEPGATVDYVETDAGTRAPEGAPRPALMKSAWIVRAG